TSPTVGQPAWTHAGMKQGNGETVASDLPRRSTDATSVSALRSFGRDQRAHDVVHIGLELIVIQPRLLQLQAELQETGVGRVGQTRSMARVVAAETGL